MVHRPAKLGTRLASLVWIQVPNSRGRSHVAVQNSSLVHEIMRAKVRSELADGTADNVNVVVEDHMFELRMHKREHWTHGSEKFSDVREEKGIGYEVLERITYF